mmetsp:Transcript_59080/g.97764  ORF Transcript_59080/g.97764 Transcript_59080/m.97764 type:complete len:177 (-) Transcript_59080:1049-1579(-)
MPVSVITIWHMLAGMYAFFSGTCEDEQVGGCSELRGLQQLWGLILSQFVIASTLDFRMLLHMFIPSKERAPIFCFGTERTQGFRFANWLISEAYIWGLLHLFKAQSVLPTILVSSSIKLPLFSFVSFTFLAAFSRWFLATKSARNDASFRRSQAYQATSDLAGPRPSRLEHPAKCI